MFGRPEEKRGVYQPEEGAAQEKHDKNLKISEEALELFWKAAWWGRKSTGSGVRQTWILISSYELSELGSNQICFFTYKNRENNANPNT